MENNEVETLGKRNWRNSEIKCTEYPNLLRDFCFRDENSRAVHGLETISVGRNLPRKPKRLFNRSREEILRDFKAEYSDGPFKR